MASRRLIPGILPFLLLLPLVALLGSPAEAGLVLSQESSENNVDTEHVVTAVATNDTTEAPMVGMPIVFEVLSGPNAGTEGACSANTDCSTDTTGAVSFSYLGDGGAGVDLIQAYYVDTSGEEPDTVRSNQLEKTWIAPNQPPVALCQDVSVDGGEACEADASIDNGSFDPDEDPITLVQEPAGPYGLGETMVSLIVTDDQGAADTCFATVTVIDSTPPEITVDLDRVALWPPNHKLVEVCAEVDVSDNCDPSPAWTLVSVSSNENDNGKGDGNTQADIQGAGLGSDDTCLLLRSERSGKGSGRVYTLEYSASDASGNTATATATVTVAHDQGGNAMAAEGRGLMDNSSVLRLVIPSQSGLNAKKIDAKVAYVGNQEGVVSPLSWRLANVTGDKRPDLILDYDPSALTVAVSGSGDPVDLYYRTDRGESFLVQDISRLPQIEVPDASDGTPVDSGDALSGPARIEIFDVQGRMIRTFSRDLDDAPSGSLGWDERDSAGRFVPGGIYFYRIQTQNRSFVRKITVVR